MRIFRVEYMGRVLGQYTIGDSAWQQYANDDDVFVNIDVEAENLIRFLTGQIPCSNAERKVQVRVTRRSFATTTESTGILRGWGETTIICDGVQVVASSYFEPSAVTLPDDSTIRFLTAPPEPTPGTLWQKILEEEDP